MRREDFKSDDDYNVFLETREDMSKWKIANLTD